MCKLCLSVKINVIIIINVLINQIINYPSLIIYHLFNIKFYQRSQKSKMSIIQSSMSTELKPAISNKTRNRKGLNLTGCMQSVEMFQDSIINFNSNNRLFASQQTNQKKAITVTMSTDRKTLKQETKKIFDECIKKLGGVKLCSQSKVQISDEKQNLEELFRKKASKQSLAQTTNIPFVRLLDSNTSQQKRNRNSSHSLSNKRKPSLDLQYKNDLVTIPKNVIGIAMISEYLKSKSQRDNSNMNDINHNNTQNNNRAIITNKSNNNKNNRCGLKV